MRNTLQKSQRDKLNLLCAFTSSAFSRACPQLSEVNDSGLVCSAVLSPLSHTTALLTVLQSGVSQHDQLLSSEVIAPATAETSAELPDVVSSVLGVVYDIMEKDDNDSVDGEDRIIIFRVQNIKTLSYLGKD